MNRFLTLAVIFTLVLSGCKYEEGPLVSFRGKKDRVVNIWTFGQVFDDQGNDVTSNYTNWWVSLDENNGVHIHWFLGAIAQDDFGTWEFADRKKSIHLTYNNPLLETYFPKQFLIQKLKNQQLKIKSNGNAIYDLSGTVQ